MSRVVLSRGSGWPSRHAISIIEIMLVVGMLTFLAALLVPGLGAARERTRRAVCMSNLRQWGVAVQFYRDDHCDYLPKEGTYLATGILKDSAWYNALPPYLGLPPYRDFERLFSLQDEEKLIRELPDMHVWICPSKNVTGAKRSGSGKNQFHYGMNQVLDGLGSDDSPSRDAPGFPDEGDADRFLAGRLFQPRPNTVFMFDICWNSPAGTPRDVATMYQRNFGARGYIGKFHGDFANVLYLDGHVGHCTTADLVTDRDFRHGQIIWDNPKLYWGYPPPWGLDDVELDEDE